MPHFNTHRATLDTLCPATAPSGSSLDCVRWPSVGKVSATREVGRQRWSAGRQATRVLPALCATNAARRVDASSLAMKMRNPPLAAFSISAGTVMRGTPG